MPTIIWSGGHQAPGAQDRALELHLKDATCPQDTQSIVMKLFVTLYDLFGHSKKDFYQLRTKLLAGITQVEGDARRVRDGVGTPGRAVYGLGGQGTSWHCAGSILQLSTWSAPIPRFCAPRLRSSPRGNLHPRQPLKKKFPKVWSPLL